MLHQVFRRDPARAEGQPAAEVERVVMSQTMEKRVPTVSVQSPDAGRAHRSWPATLGALTPAAVGVAFLVYAVRAGLPADSAARASAGVLLTQVLPGVLAWRSVRPRRGWWLEDLAMGFAIGIAIAVGAQTLAGSTGQAWISSAAGLAVAVVLLAVPGTRRRILEARTTPLPWWWGPAVGAVALVGLQLLRSYHRQVPLSWPSGARVLDVDATLHLALAGELAHRGPEGFPWVVGEPLAYHWFSHAWIAQVSVVSGAGLDEVLFRFMPAVLSLVVVVAVAIAAVRLSGRAWTGPVAAVLTMVVAEVNPLGRYTAGDAIHHLSPSLGLSVPVLLAVVVLLAVRWRGELHPAGLVLLPPLALVAAGTKGSTVPLLVAGLALAAVAMACWNRSRLRAVLVDLLIVGGCLVLAMLTVFRGSDSGLHVAPFDGARTAPAAAWLGGIDDRVTAIAALAVMVVGILARGVGVLALIATRQGRRDPMTWLLAGAGLAAGGAVAVFAHPGLSQYYFARSAVPLFALASTLGLVVLVDRLGRRIWPLVAVGVLAGPAVAFLPRVLVDGAGLSYLIGAAVLVLAAVLAAISGRTGRARRHAVAAAVTLTVLAAGIAIFVAGRADARWPSQPQPVAADRGLAVTRGQIEAARWIRDHSDPDDLVMTNRHCTRPVKPSRCDSRHFTVTAYSERHALVEAWTPTTTANRLAPNGRDSIVVDYWKPTVLGLNDLFVARPNAAYAARLRALGVRWVFVDFTRPHARTLEPHARLRFRSEGVEVYELR
jgi:hypothetical protein